MMKIILSLLTLISLTLASFSSSATFMKLNVAFAQEELSIKEASVSADSKMVKSVEYELPYPGILPDNPLYSLKMLRDRIVGFLISDPLKKAEFNLLQADKRLNSAVFLFKKGKDKYALAFSTISKGENYFEEAISKVREAKEQKMEANDLLRRLSDSAYKHQKVIKSFEKTTGQDFKEGFASLQKRAEDFKKQADLLRAQK